jgi:alpha-beta hydrolase superfamily lysophospholipase
MYVNQKTIREQGYEVFVNIYLPERSPKAVVQINHGVAEHSKRYNEFAEFLCNKGYAVYTHDHPAHGQSLKPNNRPGHLPWQGGWDLMLNVIHTINKTIRKKHPQVPVFIFGHSMGSLLTRYYNATYPMYFKGMILSGTTEPGTATLKSALLFIRLNRLFRKQDYRHKMLNNVFFKGFNRSIPNPKTDFDWLSRDPAEVEKYIKDPLCGFPLSLGFLKNLFQGSLQMLKAEKNLRFRKNFSTLIISGKNDPVGNFGKHPKIVEQKYIQQGFYRTSINLLDGRHELLNEIDETKTKTYRIIENFMESKLMGNF